VKPLHQPVGLWVVGGGLHVGDSQDVAEGGPQAGGELRTSVGRDDRGNAKPLYPAREKCCCAVGGGDAAERDGFWPAGSPVDYREKIGESPADCGRGPTRSTWTCWKRRQGMAMVSGAKCTCRETFDF
jgi:hypothetical protein